MACHGTQAPVFWVKILHATHCGDFIVGTIWQKGFAGRNPWKLTPPITSPKWVARFGAIKSVQRHLTRTCEDGPYLASIASNTSTQKDFSKRLTTPLIAQIPSRLLPPFASHSLRYKNNFEPKCALRKNKHHNNAVHMGHVWLSCVICHSTVESLCSHSNCTSQSYRASSANCFTYHSRFLQHLVASLAEN